MAERTKINLYLRTLELLKPYKAQFGLALVCMVFFGATDGVVPFLVKYILDGVFAKQDKFLLYVLPSALIVFALVRAGLDFGQQFLVARVGHNLVRDLRSKLNSHLLSLSADFFVRAESGDLLSRMNSDVLLARSMLTDSLASALRDSVRLIALLVAALYLDPLLALIAFLLFPLGIYPVYRFGRRLRKLGKVGQEAIGKVSSMLQESVVGYRVVRIFAREKFEQERFDEENRRLTNTFVRAEKVRALGGPVNEILASFVISGVILYGGLSVISGVRSQGDFVAFLLSVFLLYDPFKKISRMHNTVQQGLAGMERIYEILDQKPSVQECADPLPLPRSHEIHFENVTFWYKPERIILQEVTLNVPERSKVAIVGFSGSGKTTLVDLVARFIDPKSGRVLLGGVDIARLKICQLRSRVSMVSQHTFLFNDTVYNNIAYGLEGASPEQITLAARAAYALEFIEGLPQGFHTVIGEGGFTLSGGERQRIAIARAILKNAPILILDEATASLDNKSEREVQAALESLEKDRTTLVIAHRLSTVRDADLIVVLRQGKIVEVGKHQELLSFGGEYARLHQLQFSDVADPPELDEVVIN